MTSYTVKFREDMVCKVLSADRVDSMLTISKNHGVSLRSLKRWVKSYREKGRVIAPLSKNDKVQAVLLTANLPFEERAIYCRKNSMLIEELDEWEQELKDTLSAGAVSASEHAKVKQEKEDLKKQLLAKEKELARKDKALAEAAALLLLQKKVQKLLGEEDKSSSQD